MKEFLICSTILVLSVFFILSSVIGLSMYIVNHRKFYTYQVYQNGIIIDTICISWQGDSFANNGIYYKTNKESCKEE